MKRKKVLTILGVSVAVVAIVVVSLALIFNWGAGGYRFEIAVSTTIFDEGEQEVDIYFTNENAQASASFKSTVTTNDILFEGDLRGRTVTKVVRTSKVRLTLTLGGKCVASSAASDKNKIVVLGDAVSDGKTYACIVGTVKQSGIFVESSSSEGGVYTSVFGITSGSHFDEEYINKNSIILTNSDGDAVEFDVVFDLENMTVTVTISDFESSENRLKPEVRFSEETTSLGREFVFLVG